MTRWFGGRLSDLLCVCMAVLLLWASSGIAKQESERIYERPPLSPVRITGEIVGGMFAGLMGGVMLSSLDAPGVIMGLALGNATGVYLVGSIGDQTGSWGITMLGVLAGGIVGVAGGLAIHAVRGEVEDEDPAGLFIFFSPAIGGTLGFNMTRRYRAPTALETALINFTDGQVNLDTPCCAFRPVVLSRDDVAWVYQAKLVSVKF